MKNLLPVILIVLGLALGIYGIMQFGDSGKSLDVAGIEISAKDKGARQQSFLYIGLGAVSILGGVFLSKRK